MKVPEEDGDCPTETRKVVISAGISVAAWLMASVFGVSTPYQVVF